MVPPDCLQRSRLQELEDSIVLKGGRMKSLMIPPWLSQVCGNREHLRTAVLILTPADATPPKHFKFLYAKKQPRTASFCPLTLSSVRPLIRIVTSANWEDIAMENWKWRFDIDLTKVVSATDMPWHPGDTLSV